MSEKNLKHLDYIQNVIARMSTCSFSIKTAAVTIASAIFALTTKSASQTNTDSLLYFVPIFAFWYLDTYYLYQERLFRDLYDKVRSLQDDTDFSMKTDSRGIKGMGKFLLTAICPPLSVFYIVILLSLGFYFRKDIMNLL